jgi:S1-C subfamily serine protease
MSRHFVRWSVLALVAASLVGGRAAAQDVDTEKLYQKVVRSAVYIITPMEESYASGSGSLIDVEKRYVLTNEHVVDKNAVVYVQFPMFSKDGLIIADKGIYKDRVPQGLAIPGRVLHRDKTRDLAIVQLDRIPLGTPAIPLARKSASPGASVWNIGSPGAVPQLFSITGGTVRTVGTHKMQFSKDDFVTARVVTATNPANPGDSGGPLFNKEGHQVAVTQSVRRGVQQVNTFIDVMEVRSFLNERKLTIKEQVPDDSPPPDPKAGPSLAPPPEKLTPEGEEAEAKKLLSLAGAFADGEDNRPAYIEKLKAIVKKYPNTAAGKEAARKLKDLGQ